MNISSSMGFINDAIEIQIVKKYFVFVYDEYLTYLAFSSNVMVYLMAFPIHVQIQFHVQAQFHCLNMVVVISELAVNVGTYFVYSLDYLLYLQEETVVVKEVIVKLDRIVRENTKFGVKAKEEVIIVQCLLMLLIAVSVVIQFL